MVSRAVGVHIPSTEILLRRTHSLNIPLPHHDPVICRFRVTLSEHIGMKMSHFIPKMSHFHKSVDFYWSVSVPCSSKQRTRSFHNVFCVEVSPMSADVLAKNLRKLRRERKWTQRDLARASGVSRRTIGRYEWGGAKPRKPNPRTLEKLADALGCTVARLWSGRELSRQGGSERRRQLVHMVREMSGGSDS